MHGKIMEITNRNPSLGLTASIPFRKRYDSVNHCPPGLLILLDEGRLRRQITNLPATEYPVGTPCLFYFSLGLVPREYAAWKTRFSRQNKRRTVLAMHCAQESTDRPHRRKHVIHRSPSGPHVSLSAFSMDYCSSWHRERRLCDIVCSPLRLR